MVAILYESPSVQVLLTNRGWYFRTLKMNHYGDAYWSLWNECPSGAWETRNFKQARQGRAEAINNVRLRRGKFSPGCNAKVAADDACRRLTVNG